MGNEITKNDIELSTDYSEDLKQTNTVSTPAFNLERKRKKFLMNP